MKVKFHPLFIIFICCSIFFGNAHLVVSYLFALIIHEMGHAVVAQYFKNELTLISFMPYGAAMNLKNESMDAKQELLVALAGPIVNIIACGFVIALWWLFPVVYNFTFYFCFASIITAAINLLPIIPLDGARVILAVSSMFRKRLKVYKLLKVITIATSLVFFVLFLISVFSEINFSFALFSIFIFIGVFGGEDSVYIKNYMSKFTSKGVIRTKTIVVKKGFKLKDVYRYLSSEYYLILLVMNDENKIIRTVYEGDLINLFTGSKC